MSVLCHATESIYTLNVDGWASTNIPSRILMIISFTIGRLGVPIFLFLTGALVLKKSIEHDEDIVKFYKKNLITLLVANIIWVLIYNIFFLLTGQAEKVTIEAVLKEIFLMQLVPVPNMWYFPMIIGMYLGLPFVAKLVKTFSPKTISILAGTIFFASFILPFINTIFKIYDIRFSLEFLPELQFLGGAYGLYILLGYFLTKSSKIPKIETTYLILIALISFIITCVTEILSYSKGSHYNYNVWYDFPFILICASSIFALIIRIQPKNPHKKLTGIITFISKASLAIFFMHIMAQDILRPSIVALNLNMPAKLLLLFVTNFILCTIICFILSRVKFISKWVLRIKN